jgi:hypothetical protein
VWGCFLTPWSSATRKKKPEAVWGFKTRQFILRQLQLLKVERERGEEQDCRSRCIKFNRFLVVADVLITISVLKNIIYVLFSIQISLLSININ